MPGSENGDQEGGQLREPNMMMPMLMGAPWAAKFSGSKSDTKLREWKAQVNIMLGFQTNMTDVQKADFVLLLLEEDAKREILALEAADRNTPKKNL